MEKAQQYSFAGLPSTQAIQLSKWLYAVHGIKYFTALAQAMMSGTTTRILGSTSWVYLLPYPAKWAFDWEKVTSFSASPGIIGMILALQPSHTVPLVGPGFML